MSALARRIGPLGAVQFGPVVLGFALVALLFPWALLPLLLIPLGLVALLLAPAGEAAPCPAFRPTFHPWTPRVPRGPPAA